MLKSTIVHALSIAFVVGFMYYKRVVTTSLKGVSMKIFKNDRINTPGDFAVITLSKNSQSERIEVSRLPGETNWSIDSYTRGDSTYWAFEAGSRGGVPRMMSTLHPAQAELASMF